MIISMIAAMAKNRVIGADNKMPWHLPADLKHFKATTMSKPIIMGRRTYDSIGKALPGRLNIVVTQDKTLEIEDVIVVNSTESALLAAKGAEEVMIIGGGKLYESFLPLCNRLYLTQIDLDVEGDTYFPDYLTGYHWEQISQQAVVADDNNPYECQFVILDRLTTAL